jgi:hypothetical protein
MNPSNHPAISATKGIFGLVSLAMILWSGQTLAQSIRSEEEVARVLAIEKIAVKGQTVSGEVHNLSSNTLRDVQVYIRYIWIWDNEFHPGSNDPSTSFIYTVPQEIPPGGRVPFTFSPPSQASKASAGDFMIRVPLAGFTEIIPQTR